MIKLKYQTYVLCIDEEAETAYWEHRQTQDREYLFRLKFVDGRLMNSASMRHGLRLIDEDDDDWLKIEQLYIREIAHRQAEAALLEIENDIKV